MSRVSPSPSAVRPLSDWHPDEQAARVRLAACYRIFAMLGWTEMIYNHITLRLPASVSGADKQFLINPFGLHYTEVTASNLVKINLAGDILCESKYPINPAGYVPTLVLDNGEVLTEGPAIVQYLADQAPASKLAPPAGSFERVRLQEVLNYISTELHKSFSPLFNPAAPEDWKTFMRGQIVRRLEPMEKRVAGGGCLMGGFSVADAYLFTILGWTRLVGIDLKAERPALAEYQARIKARPGVEKAMREEGLIKS